MPYIVAKGRGKKAKYLGFDDLGYHQWVGERLDAIRFNSLKQVEESCYAYLEGGMARTEACDGNGEYRAYQGYEIQVFKRSTSRFWSYRVREIRVNAEYEYNGGFGYVNRYFAVAAAEAKVNKIINPPIFNFST